MQTPFNSDPKKIDYSAMPDERGHFGPYGGRFVSETLIAALDELKTNWKDSETFVKALDKDLNKTKEELKAAKDHDRRHKMYGNMYRH